MVFVDKSEAIRFITDCMSSVGCDKDVGEQVGELLTTADAKGHGSHGINRLEKQKTSRQILFRFAKVSFI